MKPFFVGFMDKFQLECIPTDDLIKLRRDVSDVLKLRQFEKKRHRVISKRDKPGNIYDHSDLTIEISTFNRSGFFTPPEIQRNGARSCIRYMEDLWHQDWGSIFHDSGGEKCFYVYAHVDPSLPNFCATDECGGSYGGAPFYIGKGSGNRAFDLKRNQGHGLMIRQLLGKGYKDTDIVKIICSELKESEAYAFESKLIYFFGRVYDKERSSSMLLNLDSPKTPQFTGGMIKYPGKKHASAMESAAIRIARERIS